MNSLKIVNLVFFVRSMEQIPCPCCGEHLSVIGSRRRKYRTSQGFPQVLVIRRLKCDRCGRIHHELPDILVPYKRYSCEAIEPVVANELPLTVAVDESTITRWRKWFGERAEHFAGCLESIRIRFGYGFAGGPSALSLSVLHRIWHYVGSAPSWLARVVRSVANINQWIHTRFAFCPSW